ncbi:MAG: YqaA family protein [Bryobacteraceae bacterium]
MVEALVRFLINLGGIGLLLLSAADSSMLFIPLGNDLLLVALTATRPDLVLYFCFMATAGSVIGVALVDLVSRKGGEAGLERRISPERFQYVKRKVESRGAWALALASVLPPPFPFTAFVAGAAALQYPRKRLLLVVGAFRFLRFLAAGFLAVWLGERVFVIGESAAFRLAVFALITVSIAGSIVSLIHWFRKAPRPA